MKQPLVYLLVLNYGSPGNCVECIAVARHLNYQFMRLLVINNASPDDSVKQLQSILQPDEILVLPNLWLKGMYLFQLKDQSFSYPWLLKWKLKVLANNLLGKSYYACGVNA